VAGVGHLSQLSQHKIEAGEYRMNRFTLSKKLKSVQETPGTTQKSEQQEYKNIPTAQKVGQIKTTGNRL
jgi:hypothetical protein